MAVDGTFELSEERLREIEAQLEESERRRKAEHEADAARMHEANAVWDQVLKASFRVAAGISSMEQEYAYEDYPTMEDKLKAWESMMTHDDYTQWRELLAAYYRLADGLSGFRGLRGPQRGVN